MKKKSEKNTKDHDLAIYTSLVKKTQACKPGFVSGQIYE